MKTKRAKLDWKVLTIVIAFVIIAIMSVLLLINERDNAETNSSSTTETEQNSTSEQTVSTIDSLMTDFTGSDEEVVQICETELQALDIEYVSIDQPLEGVFIQETRVGTYELNGILRTPSVSPDMPQPKSTEMLCTIFPGDEYPVEITFGKDW